MQGGNLYGPMKFLEHHSAIWSLVLPRQATEQILAVPSDGNWETVQDQVQEVVASSMLGKKVFGFAVKQILGSVVSYCIHHHLEQLARKARNTSHDVVQMKKAAMEELSKIPNIASLPDKRVIKLVYREYVCDAKVACTLEEVELAVASKV